mgnify:CR=1 FL=1
MRHASSNRQVCHLSMALAVFQKKLNEFVDQLKEGGQSFWQILPLGPTVLGIRLIRHFLLLQEILILLIWSS